MVPRVTDRNDYAIWLCCPLEIGPSRRFMRMCAGNQPVKRMGVPLRLEALFVVFRGLLDRAMSGLLNGFGQGNAAIGSFGKVVGT